MQPTGSEAEVVRDEPGRDAACTFVIGFQRSLGALECRHAQAQPLPVHSGPARVVRMEVGEVMTSDALRIEPVPTDLDHNLVERSGRPNAAVHNGEFGPITNQLDVAVTARRESETRMRLPTEWMPGASRMIFIIYQAQPATNPTATLSGIFATYPTSLTSSHSTFPGAWSVFSGLKTTVGWRPG